MPPLDDAGLRTSASGHPAIFFGGCALARLLLLLGRAASNWLRIAHATPNVTLRISPQGILKSVACNRQLSKKIL
jgi:hypothetical protein